MPVPVESKNAGAARDFVYKVAYEFCLEGYAYRAGDAVNFSIGQGEAIVTPTTANDCHHVWNQFTVRVTNGRRDALQKHLSDRKIGSAIYYPVPLHLQKCFAPLGCEKGSLPETEKACREVLSLPVYPEMTEAEQSTVIDAVAEFCQGRTRAAA